MRNLIAEPLRAESFASYGEVLESPAETGRNYFNDSLLNGRAKAVPSLSVVRVTPAPALPIVATKLERHAFSSQSFVPIDAGRWLIVVAPKNNRGGPDADHARAFVAQPDQGITFRADVWHHPLCVLDRPARFAIFMWLEAGSGTDEEFTTLAQPFTVSIA